MNFTVNLFSVLTNKNFTLTHLSPQRPRVVSQRVLKAIFAHNADQGQYRRFTRLEHCKNPWKNKCKSENIKLYILFKGQKLPICKQCWNSISEKELDW